MDTSELIIIVFVCTVFFSTCDFALCVLSMILVKEKLLQNIPSPEQRSLLKRRDNRLDSDFLNVGLQLLRHTPAYLN